MKPVVSVVIPTCNRSGDLKNAVKSVVAQSYSFWEIIIIDDASTDDTTLVARSLLSERIHYERLAVRSGANVARNRGIALAQGEYVAFLDDDDLWLPGKLAAQMLVMEREHPPLVRTPFISKSIETGRTFLTHRTARWSDNLLKSVFHRNYFGTTSTLLCKKSALLAVGCFDESLPMLQDLDLIIRLLILDPRVGEVSEPMVIYAIYSNRSKISGDYTLYTQARHLLSGKYRNHPYFSYLSRYLFRIFIGKMVRYRSFRIGFFRSLYQRRADRVISSTSL